MALFCNKHPRHQHRCVRHSYPCASVFICGSKSLVLMASLVDRRCGSVRGAISLSHLWNVIGSIPAPPREADIYKSRDKSQINHPRLQFIFEEQAGCATLVSVLRQLLGYDAVIMPCMVHIAECDPKTSSNDIPYFQIWKEEWQQIACSEVEKRWTR